MRLFWLLLFGFFLFRFVTRFLIPVLNVTRQTSRRMREMQEQMNSTKATAGQPQQAKHVEGTYIDYEEVK